jgi:hypothetical protein
MTYTVKQGSRVDYNYKEIYLDTEDELSTIDTKTLCPGSVAYVIATGTVYILNSQYKWIAQ